MGKINYGRVVLGGIVAGIVATILDWFSNTVLLGQLWAAEAKSINRTISISGPVAFGLILVEFVGGIAAVWTYAAIRPRLGAGGRTAAYAGLISWIFVSLPVTANALQGILSPRAWFYSTLLGLVSSIVSTVAGAALYKEEATVAYPAAAPQATH
jgi:hypothetical protein